EDGAGKTDLLERLHVHEVMLAVAGVQVVHRLALEDRLLHLLPGSERLLESGARLEVLQPGPNKRAALPRLHMLELNDGVDVAVHDDRHPVAEITGIDQRVFSWPRKNRSSVA